jgi:hypothetical protein
MALDVHSGCLRARTVWDPNSYATLAFQQGVMTDRSMFDAFAARKLAPECDTAEQRLFESRPR